MRKKRQDNAGSNPVSGARRMRPKEASRTGDKRKQCMHDLPFKGRDRKMGKEKKAKAQIGRNLLAHVCSFDINVQLDPQEASERNPKLLCWGSGSMSR